MREQKPAVSGLMRIGELAEAAGVNVTTLKFYAKEGLIRPACKTGRNMAWYDPDCITTIRTIRALQKERFYPLSVIKHILESPRRSQVEMDLLDAIHKADRTPSGAPASLEEAVKISGLSEDQIACLAEEGLITPADDDGRQTLTGADMTVLSLVRRRMDAGIPFAQTVRAFGIYALALRQAAREDVDAFIAGAVLAEDLTAEAGTRIIRASDESLDIFVALKRKEYNRAYGSGRLEDLYRFEARLFNGLARIAGVLGDAGLAEAAAVCREVLAGEGTGGGALAEAARHYLGFAAGGVAGCIAAGARSRRYFQTLDPETAGDAVLPAYCLKLCWLCLAPDILACGEQARRTLADFEAYLRRDFPGAAEALFLRIREIVLSGGVL